MTQSTIYYTQQKMTHQYLEYTMFLPPHSEVTSVGMMNTFLVIFVLSWNSPRNHSTCQLPTRHVVIGTRKNWRRERRNTGNRYPWLSVGSPMFLLSIAALRQSSFQFQSWSERPCSNCLLVSRGLRGWRLFQGKTLSIVTRSSFLLVCLFRDLFSPHILQQRFLFLSAKDAELCYEGTSS